MSDFQEWRELRNCRDIPTEVFYPERGDNLGMEAAKSICRKCVVREECAEFALQYDMEDGVFGGLSGNQRRQIRRSRKEAA